MKYNTILITGGAGFIGSNLAVYLKKKYPKAFILALDNLKRRGSELNIERLSKYNVAYLHGDIRNKEDLVLEDKIDLIVECSAEPSVLAGVLDNPEYVINTNLIGAINCLELARVNKADFVFLSTSRVYPYDALNRLKVKQNKTRFLWQAAQRMPGWSMKGIDTSFSLDGPKSLYGATKLSAELFLKEYIHTYGIKGVINRCGVIAGPWQFGKVDQGVFSLWMKQHYHKKPLSYIGFGGEGKQVRDLLHVDDLCELIDIQLESLKEKGDGDVYNVGGGEAVSLSLQETTTLCEQISGNKIKILSQGHNRPFDIPIYITDNRKVESVYGWKPKKSKETILEDIYSWLRSIGAKDVED